MRSILVFLCGLGFVLLVAVGIHSCQEYQTREAERWQRMLAECEAKGGVLLDRTYSYGKGQTGHNYTCIDKNAIR